MSTGGEEIRRIAAIFKLVKGSVLLPRPLKERMMVKGKHTFGELAKAADYPSKTSWIYVYGFAQEV